MPDNPSTPIPHSSFIIQISSFPILYSFFSIRVSNTHLPQVHPLLFVSPFVYQKQILSLAGETCPRRGACPRQGKLVPEGDTTCAQSAFDNHQSAFPTHKNLTAPYSFPIRFFRITKLVPGRGYLFSVLSSLFIIHPSPFLISPS